MRAKLYVLVGVVVLMAAGAAWAYSVSGQTVPAPDVPAPEATVAGCCETGDCCCPGAGNCCDPAKRVSADVAKALRKAESCCVTGDCCCPGAGSCCAAPADGDAKPSCCQK
jgi:hypothetical protein